MQDDQRHHVTSPLMRESLLDKDVIAGTETPVVRMLPFAHVVKIGGHVIDHGREIMGPLVHAIGAVLDAGEKLILGTGGGVRARHSMSIALDLGLPTGVLASLTIADALGNAHILGTLLAPHGVVAIPPAILGHLLPLFIRSAPGVIFNGDPPYGLWEHPPGIGRIPPHRTDAGSFLLAECFGAKTLTLVKDVDGLYTKDPKRHPDAERIDDITVADLRALEPPTLPFDRVVLDLLETARLIDRFQIVPARRPDLLAPALRGERVGSVVRAR